MRTAGDHRARAVYLEARAVGLEFRLRPDASGAGGYELQIAADTLEALDPEARQQARDRLRANRAGLVRLLLDGHDLDVQAVLQEGGGR